MDSPIIAKVNNISIITAALCFTTTVGDTQSNFGRYKFITNPITEDSNANTIDNAKFQSKLITLNFNPTKKDYICYYT